MVNELPATIGRARLDKNLCVERPVRLLQRLFGRREWVVIDSRGQLVLSSKSPTREAAIAFMERATGHPWERLVEMDCRVERY